MNAMTFHSATLVCLAATLGGCGLSKPYPAKQLYTIDVPAPEVTALDRSDAVLRVANIRIAAPFDAQAFHYTSSPNQFESDYYMNFITQPGNIITGELVQFLSAAGPYTTTVDGSSSVSTTRTLETLITALYGDYTNNPQAVVTAKFFLLDTQSAEPRVLFEKEYSQSTPMDTQDAASLVAGWSDALRQTFESLSQDLATAEATQP